MDASRVLAGRLPSRRSVGARPRGPATSGLLLGAMALLGGCALRHQISGPLQDGRRSQDRAILSHIRQLGRDGDWLVVRSYTAAAEAITSFTDMPLSHAAVLDLTHDRVIEADGQGVHPTPLATFVTESHRLMLMRPLWSDARAGREAVAVAATHIGKPYDIGGLVGIDDPESYYCTELVLDAWRRNIRSDALPPVVAPGQLYFWARVLWDSGPRRGEEVR